MHPLEAYREQASSWTRIEMLIAAFEGTIARIKTAQNLIDEGNRSKALPLLLRAQRLLFELYAGLDVDQGDIPQNLQRIYLYVLDKVSAATQGSEANLTHAADVLSQILSSLERIKEEAVELERKGVIPSLSSEPMLARGGVG